MPARQRAVTGPAPAAAVVPVFHRLAVGFFALGIGVFFIALLVSEDAANAVGWPNGADSLRQTESLAPLVASAVAGSVAAPSVVAFTPSPQPPIAAVHSELAIADLRSRLVAERDRVSARFSAPALAESIVHGAGISAALGARLTAAVLDSGPFVVGVTGGSSTAGRHSWPAALQAWLRSDAVGAANAEVRNAGQGTTSQLITAPCIRALAGDGLDLLLWEFAMNDEYEYVVHDSAPNFPIRRRVAEAYIRQAAQLAPGALGFVHLWDLDIHHYAGGPGLPNKAFSPTNAVASAYSPVFDRYFALDVIGAMWTSGLYTDKSAFLRDPHHPNDELGYASLNDLLAYSILTPWIAYLDAGAPPQAPLTPAAVAAAAAAVRAHPMLTLARDDLFLPGERTLAHCYMAMPPQFSDPASGALRAVHGPECSATDTRDCDPTVNVGRSDADRDDRQLRFTPTKCTGGDDVDAGSPTSGGMLFSADVRRLAAVLIDCGYGEGDYCLNALDVFLDGKAIKATHAPNDILAAFYKWAHKVDLDALADSPTHSLRVCARGDEAHFSRLVVLEQF